CAIFNSSTVVLVILRSVSRPAPAPRGTRNLRSSYSYRRVGSTCKHSFPSLRERPALTCQGRALTRFFFVYRAATANDVSAERPLQMQRNHLRPVWLQHVSLLVDERVAETSQGLRSARACQGLPPDFAQEVRGRIVSGPMEMDCQKVVACQHDRSV